MIRHFVKDVSVFADWREDTLEMSNKAFVLDSQFIKSPKFIKDKDDLDATHSVLRKHFQLLKNEFLNLCSNPKFYPVITWLEFSKACKQWQLFDEYLSSSDIDRLFVAVNYEETDLDNNDDNSLCRYEFSEIAARIGKEKYYDNGLTNSIAEGTRKLIEEHIIPNTCEKMQWQEFRDTRLWVLEVDDFFKLNKAGIDQLFNYGMKGPHTKDAFSFT